MPLFFRGGQNEMLLNFAVLLHNVSSHYSQLPYCGIVKLVSLRRFLKSVHFGGELDSTGQFEVRVACRGWSAGHVKSRPKNLIAESNLTMAA